MATFGTLSDRLVETFKNLRTKGRLSASDVDGTVREIRRALLDADVALEVVKQFTADVRDRALGDEVNKALNPAQQVVQIVNEELVKILGGEQRKLQFAKNPPTVIMLAGLQGSGQDDLRGQAREEAPRRGPHARCSSRPTSSGRTPSISSRSSASRPARSCFAPEPGQRRQGDPVKASKAGVELAQSEAARHRHHRHGGSPRRRRRADASGLEDPEEATDPDEVLFVIDSMIGQDAVNTAKAFQEGVDFTGVVLSKLDGDARGGAALSVASLTGRPIIFASTGESLDALEDFHPDRMASRILDLGDVLDPHRAGAGRRSTRRRPRRSPTSSRRRPSPSTTSSSRCSS